MDLDLAAVTAPCSHVNGTTGLLGRMATDQRAPATMPPRPLPVRRHRAALRTPLPRYSTPLAAGDSTIVVAGHATGTAWGPSNRPPTS